MAIEDYYEDLTLSQATTIVNEYGVEETTYTETTIRGVINQAGSSEIEYAKARNIDVDHHCYVEVTATTQSISKNDEINGFRVTSEPKNTMGRDHHLKILLSEVV